MQDLFFSIETLVFVTRKAVSNSDIFSLSIRVKNLTTINSLTVVYAYALFTLIERRIKRIRRKIMLVIIIFFLKIRNFSRLFLY